MSTTSASNKYDRARNELDRIKKRVLDEASPDDREAIVSTFKFLGRYGYRAKRAIDTLDEIIGTTDAEALVQAAATVIRAQEQLYEQIKQSANKVCRMRSFGDLS